MRIGKRKVSNIFSRTIEKTRVLGRREKTKNKEGEPRGESIAVDFCSS